jgi:hypothetical protein
MITIYYNKSYLSRVLGLMPIILATQEAEMRRVVVWKPALGK